MAPAGFGKSELIAAWRCLMHREQQAWEAIAVTGVAATSIGGRTVHNMLMLNTEGSTRIMDDPERKQELSRVQGLIIDEAMMATGALLRSVCEVLREIPLRADLRRVDSEHSLAAFGHRDVIVCGDVRQLPPADDEQPFWATGMFQRLFEVMCLRDDRRHERDLGMQRLKELFAWGGCVPPARGAAPGGEGGVEAEAGSDAPPAPGPCLKRLTEVPAGRAEVPEAAEA